MDNQISLIENVHGYVDTNDVVWLNAEDVAKGFGFTQTKNNTEYVRWETLNGYLQDFGFSQLVGKNSYLPENMVYRLGFKANNKVAVTFQAKLADDILPTIRKTGSYNSLPKDYLSALKELVKQVESNQKLIAENNELKPDAQYTREVLTSTTTWTTTVIAKELGMSAIALNKFLCDHDVQYKQRGMWVLKAKYQDKGYTATKTSTFLRSNGSTGTSISTVWTEAGRRFIHDMVEQCSES